MDQTVSHRIARNSLANVAGQVGMRVLSFAYGVAVVHQLGDEKFGQYATASALVGILAVGADLGMSNYVVREIAKHQSRTVALFANMVVLRLLLASVVFVVNLLLAWLLGYDLEMIGYVGLASLGLALYSVHGPLAAVLQGHERIDYTVRLNVLNQVVLIAVGGLLLWRGWGIIGVFVASFCGIITISVLAWRAAKRIIDLPFKVDARAWLPLLRAGLPFAITTFATMLSFRIDTVLLSVWRPFEEVGWYNVAYSLIFALLGLASSFNSALVPSLARQYQLDPGAVGQFYLRAIKLLWVSVLPIAVGTAMLAERLVALIYGPDFAPAADALRILIWVLPVLTITALCGSITTVYHRERATARINMINAGFNIALNLWAIPRYGLMGAAVMTVATEALGLLQYGLLLRDAFPLRQVVAALVSPLVAVVAMGVVVVLLAPLHVLVIIPVAAMIYGAMLLASGAIRPVELQVIGQTTLGVFTRRKAAAPK